MIDLVRRKEQLEIWIDKEAGIKNAYVWKDKWVRASREDIYGFTIGDLFAGRIRFMGEMFVDTRKVYVVTMEMDEAPLRAKYPEAVVLNVTQLLGFFKKPLDEERENILPAVMMCLSVFPEATVIA